MSPENFWARVDKRGADDCWEWLGFHPPHRYGQMSRTKGTVGEWPRQIGTHRYAYFLHYGRHPGELMVLHSCDNPPCCNPKHLRLGDGFDNAADRAERNPVKPLKGSEALNAKLRETDVLVIKLAFVDRAYGDIRCVAREFGVRPSTIANIVNGSAWAHIDPAALSEGDAEGLRPRVEALRSKFPRRRQCGSQIGHSKLVERDVAYIKATIDRHDTSAISRAAHAHNVAYGTIVKILKGETWRHVAPAQRLLRRCTPIPVPPASGPHAADRLTPEADQSLCLVSGVPSDHPFHNINATTGAA